MSKKSDIYTYLNIEDILPDTPRCPDCNSDNTFVDKNNNTIFCNSCDERKDFFKTIFHNLLDANSANNQNKLINKLHKKAIAAKERKEYIENILEGEKIEVNSNDELKANLMALNDKTAMILEAPTGCGKTHTIVEYAATQYELNNKVTIICSTIKEVHRSINMLVNAGVSSDDISAAISGYETDFEDGFSVSQGYKKIVVTTYAYFFEKGHTDNIYATVKKITEGRIILADEIHAIKTYAKRVINFGARYYLDGNVLKKADKCPIAMRKARCLNCYILTDHKLSRHSEVEYPSEILLSLLAAEPRNSIENNALYTPEYFTGASLNTVLTKPIDNISEVMQYWGDFNDLTENIINPEDAEIRMQNAYIVDENDNKKYISHEKLLNIINDTKKKEKLVTPNYPCGIPCLIGHSWLVFDILFSCAAKIVFASATISKSLSTKILEKAQDYGYQIQSVKVDRTPFKFNINILKYSGDISINSIIEMFYQIDTSKNRIFFVESTKRYADRAKVEICKKFQLQSKLIYFKERDYSQAYGTLDGVSETQNSSGEILLTYAGSAICKAVDMPDRNFVIVDCSLFPPTIALNFKSNLTEDEKRMLYVDDINDKLTQIIGRVFRSAKNHDPSQTVIDERNIAILLYNLPVELQGFEPNKKLINSYVSYSDEHIVGVSSTPRKKVENLIVSIQEALAGNTVTDKAAEEKRAIVEKAKKDGLSNLKRRTERELLSEKEVEEIKKYRNEL